MLDVNKLKRINKELREELSAKMKTDMGTSAYSRLCTVIGELDVLIQKLE